MTIATDEALISQPVDPVARRQTLITGWLLIGLAVFVALVFGTQVEGSATFRLSLPRDAIQVPNLVVPAAPFIYIVAGILAAIPWVPWSTRFSLRTMLIVTTLVAITSASEEVGPTASWRLVPNSA